MYFKDIGFISFIFLISFEVILIYINSEEYGYYLKSVKLLCTISFVFLTFVFSIISTFPLGGYLQHKDEETYTNIVHIIRYPKLSTSSSDSYHQNKTLFLKRISMPKGFARILYVKSTAHTCSSQIGLLYNSTTYSVPHSLQKNIAEELAIHSTAETGQKSLDYDDNGDSNLNICNITSIDDVTGNDDNDFYGNNSILAVDILDGQETSADEFPQNEQLVRTQWQLLNFENLENVAYWTLVLMNAYQKYTYSTFTAYNQQRF